MQQLEIHSTAGKTTVVLNRARGVAARLAPYWSDDCELPAVAQDQGGLTAVLGCRHYDPSVGRFTSQDTYRAGPGNTVDSNLYAYVGGDPINRIDPSGMFSLAQGLAVTGITALGIGILLPGIHGALQNGRVVAANGSTQSILTATFQGQATAADWSRAFNGFGAGIGTGAVNALNTLTFNLISPLDEYRDRLWQAQGLNQSWFGTAASTAAWVGTGALYSAALVWSATALGAPQMSISIRYTGQAPKFLHFEYGANGVWQQALGPFRGAMQTYGGYGEGLRLTGIPVLSTARVLQDPQFSYNCATAVLKAVYRGWSGW